MHKIRIIPADRPVASLFMVFDVIGVIQIMIYNLKTREIYYNPGMKNEWFKCYDGKVGSKKKTVVLIVQSGSLKLCTNCLPKINTQLFVCGLINLFNLKYYSYDVVFHNKSGDIFALNYPSEWSKQSGAVYRRNRNKFTYPKRTNQK